MLADVSQSFPIARSFKLRRLVNRGVSSLATGCAEESVASKVQATIRVNILRFQLKKNTNTDVLNNKRLECLAASFIQRFAILTLYARAQKEFQFCTVHYARKVLIKGTQYKGKV